MRKIPVEWPGKSNANGWHPALWHSLDVAAAARLILPRGRLGQLQESWQNAFIFLIALHDCGKFSDAFRKQIDEGYSPPEYNRHWQLSYRLLMHYDQLMEDKIGGEPVARKFLYAAVAGHHGRPPSIHSQDDQDAAIGEAGFAAAAELIECIAPLFQPASLDGLEEEQATRLSWLLSGTTVQADWIGSNEEWFPFDVSDINLDDYWRQTCEKAEKAVFNAGLCCAEVRPSDAVELIGETLRPMQCAVETVPLPDSPSLAIIEDTTGAGKTEAALILAQRMIAAGKARGLYFALPTMATADAMFQRMRPILRRLFDGDPSLALLHGRRLLSKEFRDVLGCDGTRPNDAGCAAWLADDRRRSLLAEIGVGTIDQALMAVLPTRFNTLRMSALSDRILIVDEAHSYDPYMEAELITLLRFQAAFGGSAILMTATLPLEMRRKFISAWRERDTLGDQPIDIPDLTPDFPALSLIGENTSSTAAVEPFPAMCRRVPVRRLANFEAALATIRAGQKQGAACLWVRNAVDDAIAAVDALREEGIAADLLHARFAMCDRLNIEARLAERFGRDGAGRAGSVLVATQIVEMSLDLDFDVMVSDLAPIESVIQRAGRLWRHMDVRPAEVRVVPEPELHVLSPDPAHVVDKHWLHQVLDDGAWVYPMDVQWRTAHALEKARAITTPEGLRMLIAEVHGTQAPDIPSCLESHENERLGQQAAEAAHAQLSLLSPHEGYGQQEKIFPDEHFPTRLGIPHMTLILTRIGDAGTLVPLSQDPDPRRARELSEVQMSKYKYQALPLPGMQQTCPEIQAFTADWKDWERIVKAVAIVADDGTICEGLRYVADRGLLIG